MSERGTLPLTWWSPTQGFIVQSVQSGNCYDVLDDYCDELSTLPEDAIPLTSDSKIMELLSAIYTQVNWKSVTRNLTIRQKTLWADILDKDARNDGERVDRWWEKS